MGEREGGIEVLMFFGDILCGEFVIERKENRRFLEEWGEKVL